MSRFSGIKTHSYAVVGTADPVEVLLYDDFRRYVMLYAKTGTCYFTVGAYNANNEIALTEGNTYEPIIMPRDQFWFRGLGATMVVVTDRGDMDEQYIKYSGNDVYAPGSSTTFLRRMME